MGIQTYPVPEALQSYILGIERIDSPGEPILVMPGTAAVMGFQTRGRIEGAQGLLAVAGVTGVQTQARTYTYLGPTTSILVRFRPQGATALGVPASALQGQSVALRDLMGGAQKIALDEFLTAYEDTQNLSMTALEAWLRRLPYQPDPVIGHALKLLKHQPVAAVARHLGISERQLERRFLARVGVPPRAYLSLRRFEKVMQRAATAPSLTALAQEAGYYDQAHFIREFRRYTGATPRRLLKP